MKRIIAAVVIVGAIVIWWRTPSDHRPDGAYDMDFVTWT